MCIRDRYSMVYESGNRNRILEMCKFRFRLVLWIDPCSVEHSYVCLVHFLPNIAQNLNSVGLGIVNVIPKLIRVKMDTHSCITRAGKLNISLVPNVNALLAVCKGMRAVLLSCASSMGHHEWSAMQQHHHLQSAAWTSHQPALSADRNR